MSRRCPWRTLLRALGFCLAIAGCFGPWIGHRTAALSVTSLELAEFARIFPQVQSGTVAVHRIWFFTPLVVGAVLGGVLVHPPSAGPVPNRRLRRLLIIPLALIALAALPPYPFLFAAPFRGQLGLAVGGFVAVFLTPLARRLPSRAWGTLVALLALVGILPALWQYALMRPLFVALYGGRVTVGWGVIASTAGFSLLTLEGISGMLKPRIHTDAHE